MSEKTTIFDGDATIRRSWDETLRRPEEFSSALKQAPKSAGRSPKYFPGSDGRRFEIVRTLNAGGEGELYLCRDGVREVVVKVLNFDSDAEILAGLSRIGDALEPVHLMPLLHMGAMREVPGHDFDPRRYVVSPYYMGGDLSALENSSRINPSIVFEGKSFSGSNADYAAVHCDYGAVDEAAFSKLVHELNTALKALHSPKILPKLGGIIHRDVRPQNILVKSDQTYVLGDFGLVSALERGVEMKFTERFGVSHGYSPPEAYSDRVLKQSVTRKYDYFSLGMTLAHIVGGRPLYLIGRDEDHLQPYEIRLVDFYEIITLSNVLLPSALPPRISNLLRGLLTASIEDRFGADEVDEWLAGGNPVVHETHADLQSGICIKVNRRTYRGEREVGLAMVENWDLFAGLVQGGELRFQWQDPDVAYLKKVNEAVARSRQMDPELGLREVIHVVWPQCGHVFRGKRFETDKDLGLAMLSADEKESENFASYLTEGGLTTYASTQLDTRQLEILHGLEKLASMRPRAAVRTAGSYLAGVPLPSLSISQNGIEEEFVQLADLTAFVRREMAGMIAAYLRKTKYDLPPVAPVPGAYPGKDGKELAIVQFDGSVIGNMNPFHAQISITPRLQAVLEWAVPLRRLQSTLDLNERLYEHLLRTERIQVMQPADSSDSSSQNQWEILMQFLGLFSEFRTQHQLDDFFLAYFKRVRQLLDCVAPVRLPRVKEGSAAGPQCIDSAKQRLNAAIRRFEDSRAYSDLYMAVLTVFDGLQEICQVSHANKAAAFHVISVFRHVFQSANTELQKKYDDLMCEYAGGLSSSPQLMEFMEKLQKLDLETGDADVEDYSPYLLSEEVEEFRRRMSQGNAPDYVLPDTVRADESFAYLQSWLRAH